MTAASHLGRSKSPSAARSRKRPSAKAKAAGAQLARKSGEISYYKRIFLAGPMERIAIVKAGIPAADAKRILSDLDVTARAIHLPVSTFNRKVKQQQVLAPEDSERVVGLAKLIGQVQAMVEESGDPDGFDARAWTARWLGEPLPALGGVAPMTLMDTMEGQALVSQALARARSGSYA